LEYVVTHTDDGVRATLDQGSCHVVTLILGLLGTLAFVTGVAVLGSRLRKHPSQANAEKSSRIMHALFFGGLVGPTLVMVIYPGLTHLDELISLNPLPWRPFFRIASILLAMPGLVLFGLSNKSLRNLGSGANAFLLTRRIVEKNVYRYTRNPMSLGYYLVSLGVAFISGSTLATLGVLFGLIPAHLFFLKYFEEVELGLRFGGSYERYRRKVPFLIPRSPAGESG
jgi:protein-S-isoprenylcysteine O-methyltransferase Ste14